MPSSRTQEEPVGSGISLPPGASRPRWIAWFRRTRGRHHPFRAGVFCAGLLLLALGAAAWLFSSVLAAVPVLLGLWVWSKEFHWAHRLFRAFGRRCEALWSRVRARPVRWTIITLGGIASGWGAYWAWGHLSPF